MGISTAITKVKSQRVCGIDASTNSLAFAIFEGDTPIKCGEIKFRGATVFERLKDARKRVKALVKAGTFDGVDYIVIESAIMVRNVQTAIDLAYVYGVIIGEMSQVCKELHKVAPISWQSKIGVPNLKAYEKQEIKNEFPGKSASWYQNKGRLIRKQRIADKASEFFPGYLKEGNVTRNLKITDNVTDAIGIAWYASQHLTR